MVSPAIPSEGPDDRLEGVSSPYRCHPAPRLSSTVVIPLTPDQSPAYLWSEGTHFFQLFFPVPRVIQHRDHHRDPGRKGISWKRSSISITVLPLSG
jgi:hypothetical protein